MGRKEERVDKRQKGEDNKERREELIFLFYIRRKLLDTDQF